MVEKVQKVEHKSAYCAGHPYLPDLELQIAAADAWGIVGPCGGSKWFKPIFADDVMKTRTTNWRPLLKERWNLLREFIDRKWPDDVVFFYNHLCVGWTANLAQEMVETLQKAEARIYIHSTEQTFAPGDNMADFWEAHRKAVKAAEMKKYRKPKKSK